MKSKWIFYSVERDAILNSLLKFIPANSPFNLYDINQKEKIEYKDFITEGLSNVEQTYIEITKHLIHNNFVKDTTDLRNIFLTEKGRQLLDYGSYKRFAKAERHRQIAEKRELWRKRNWVLVVIITIFLTVVIGALLTLGIQKCSEKESNSQTLKSNTLKTDTLQ